jgi:hypothetical protein
MYSYVCPDCRTESNIHEYDCEFEGTERAVIERAYIDIISRLSLTPFEQSTLEELVNEWSDLHEACFYSLWGRNHITLRNDGKFRLRSSDEREKSIHPTFEPLKTIFEHGSVAGCHDNAVFSLIAWYANQDLSWEETKEQLHTWFSRTGSWNSSEFEEASIDDLLEKKKHVWDEAYGWDTTAKAAKRVIEQKRKALTAAQGGASPATG